MSATQPPADPPGTPADKPAPAAGPPRPPAPATGPVDHATQDPEHPTARVERRGPGLLGWLLPLGALAFALFLAFEAWGGAGPTIRVRAREGHGIRAGDELRYRGIAIGEIRAIELAEGLAGVVLEVELDPGAADLARAGSRFWVVRPHLSLDGVQGLETIVGARYLAVAPGPADAPPQEVFLALEEPPVLEELERGGLEVLLQAERRSGIRPGAPIDYRGIEVGTVLSVGLASDARTVDMRAWIRPAYAQLVRANSIFWEISGLDVQLGLGGLRVELESLRSLAVGGVAIATPNDAGPPVSTGHRFVLRSEPERDAQAWAPPLPMGSDLVADGPSPPRPLRATLTTRQRSGRSLWILRHERERAGWVLPLSTGLVGPLELLAPEGGVEPVLEAGGERAVLEGIALERGRWLARLDWKPASAEAWPVAQTRALAAAEEVLVVGDPSGTPLAIDSGRLAAEDGRWSVDRELSIDAGWHGAAVVARRDGKLVGMLVVEKGRAFLAPLP